VVLVTAQVASASSVLLAAEASVQVRRAVCIDVSKTCYKEQPTRQRVSRRSTQESATRERANKEACATERNASAYALNNLHACKFFRLYIS
jgi:hypothetical protein